MGDRVLSTYRRLLDQGIVLFVQQVHHAIIEAQFCDRAFGHQPKHIVQTRFLKEQQAKTINDPQRSGLLGEHILSVSGSYPIGRGPITIAVTGLRLV